MAYYLDRVNKVKASGDSQHLIFEADCPLAECVQCYIGGELSGWQLPQAGAVRFAVTPVAGLAIVHLLAVDAANALVDYFAEAFASILTHGNRIALTLLLEPKYLPGDRLRVYLGAKNTTDANTLVIERALFPGGQGVGGYGQNYGSYYGYDTFGGLGYGYYYGSVYGFGPAKITWKSTALLRGRYPVKVVIVDEAGNASTGAEGRRFLDTYARPARDLLVDNYDKATGATQLSWTPSEDC